MKIISIASGSRGNCTFVKCGSTCILIDAGVSAKKIASALKNFEEDILQVGAVLITHEHTDHVCGLTELVKINPQIKIFAHSEVAEVMCSVNSLIARNFNKIISPIFYFEEIMVSAFLLPHDSAACLGYSIYYEDKKFSIATDLGFADENFVENVYDSNLLFIESNHSIKMLTQCQKYHHRLKQRILSERGHLSNIACAQVLEGVNKKRRQAGLGICSFVFCHLSQNTNCPQTAKSEIEEYLTSKGIFIEDYCFASQQCSKAFDI